MADEPKVDIKKVLEEGAQRATLDDLAQRGFRNVKVLDERTVEELINRAVDKAVSTQTSGERARIVANSRKELDRLMKERNEFMSKAGMLEAGRNELMAQIETLQNEIQLRRQLEEQGEAGFKTQLKEIVDRHREYQQRIQALEGENAELKERLGQALAEVERLRGEIEQARAGADTERSRLMGDLESARDGRARAEQELSGARRENEALKGRVEAEREKARRSEEEAKARLAEMERRIAQAAEEAGRVKAAAPERKAKAPPAEAPARGRAPSGAAIKTPAGERAPSAPAIKTPSTERAPSAPAIKTPAAARAPSGPAIRAISGKEKLRLGKGLDIGTVNLVAAEQDDQGSVQIRLMRNAFIDIAIDASTKSTLTRLKVPYVVQGNKFYVLGDNAFEMANALGKNTRRPMKDGLISPRESDALPVMKLLIGSILGEPRVADEICYYSVPGDPIDSEMSVLYHKDLFDAVLKALGYRPHHIVEGHAVVFAELGEEDFTGIGVSCGGGMFNVCVSYKSMPALFFSTSRGGDWIDNNVANVLAIKPAKASFIKEKGIDLVKPKNREEDAISIYYRDLISYTLTNVKERFLAAEGMPSFPDPITIVFSGGTSMAGGFIDLARAVFNDLEFPIPVKELRHAKDPLHATVKGCLTAALLEAAQRKA